MRTLNNREQKGCVSFSNVRTWILLVMLTLPHLNPAYLNRFPAIEMLLDGWKMASFLFCVLWVLLKRRISLVVVLTALWELLLVISTAINGGEVYGALTSALSVLSIMLLYDLAYVKQKQFLSSQLFCFELIIYINFITELIFENGMYVRDTFPRGPNWFLGYYNGYTQYIIPALMFAWLYYVKTHKIFRPALFTIVVLLSDIKVFAGGFTMVLIAMALAYILRRYTAVLNYYSYWLIHIVFFVTIVVFKLQENFKWLIDGVLGKWSSLVSRMTLWDSTVAFISRSPIIGHGIMDSTKRMTQYGLGYAIHSHNLLLEILYQGGIVGMSLWVMIVVVAGRYIYKYRDATESKIIAAAFLGWCVATLVEPFTSSFLMGMFVIAYHSNAALATKGCRLQIRESREIVRPLANAAYRR